MIITRKRYEDMIHRRRMLEGLLTTTRTHLVEAAHRGDWGMVWGVIERLENEMKRLGISPTPQTGIEGSAT